MVAAAIFGSFQLLLLLCGEGSDGGGGRGRLATSARNTAATWRSGDEYMSTAGAALDGSKDGILAGHCVPVVINLTIKVTSKPRL